MRVEACILMLLLVSACQPLPKQNTDPWVYSHIKTTASGGKKDTLASLNSR